MARFDYSLLRGLGSPITRLLTWSPVRRSALGRRIYMHLYLFGKRRAEGKQQAWFREHLRPGMTVVDMGANVGFYTIPFAEIVGASGAVHAFEPDPFCHSILRDRVRKRAIQNVRLEAAALGAAEGTVTLYCSRRDRAENRMHPFERAVAVETVDVRLLTLDGYCRERSVGHIDAVKIDVEGYEVSALTGMRGILAADPPEWMWIEFSPDQLTGAGSSARAFWELLAAHGYACYTVDSRGQEHQIDDTSAFTRTHAHEDTNIWAVHRGRGAGQTSQQQAVSSKRDM